MAFDYKKEYKELYAPKKQPALVIVPPMNFISVRGQGNPNETGGTYQQAVSVLYAIAYTLKMSYKGEYQIPGFFEYVVPPLEGFWWQENTNERNYANIDYANKDGLQWISVIRLPDFVRREDFSWAAAEATRKKKLDCSSAGFLTMEEGLCVQMLHIGSYDNEPDTIAEMNAFLSAQGYCHDLSDSRLHHEIYLSDPRKADPAKLRTIIRHPVKRL